MASRGPRDSVPQGTLPGLHRQNRTANVPRRTVHSSRPQQSPGQPALCQPRHANGESWREDSVPQGYDRDLDPRLSHASSGTQLPGAYGWPHRARPHSALREGKVGSWCSGTTWYYPGTTLVLPGCDLRAPLSQFTHSRFTHTHTRIHTREHALRSTCSRPQA